MTGTQLRYAIGENWSYGKQTWAGASPLVSIDEVTIYNYSLTPEKIYAIFNETTPAFTLGAETSQDSITFTTQLPVNNAVINNTPTINFNFTAVSPMSATMNCSIYLNNTINQTNSSTQNNTLTNFAITMPYSLYAWKINCTNGTTTNSSVYNITSNAVNRIDFVSQTPADINSSNVINNPLTIIYNITNSSAINYSQVYIYTKTNTTTNNWYAYSNGTTETVPEQRLQTSYAYPNVTFEMYDNAMYPHTENLGHTYFRSVNHTNTVSLANANQYYSTTYFYVSNSSQYGFYEQMINSSDATPVRFYVCNTSYAFSNSPSTNANCVQFATHVVNGAYEHCHNQYGANYSCHFVETFAVNGTTGTINGLKISNTMHFIIRGNAGQTIDVWGVSNVTRNGQTRLSTNSGNAWTNQTFTDDGHLHQFDATEVFYYYASFNASGTITNSTLVADAIGLAPLPPNAPNIYSPTENNYTGIININYTASLSPGGNAISFYNITLRYPDNLTVASIIQSNNSLNLSYAWNSTGTPDGLYRIGVNVTNNISLSALGFSQLFQIDNTKPTTTATAIGNNTGNPYTWSSTSLEGLNITLTCDDGAGSGCNVTRYCIDDFDICVPNITYTGTISSVTLGTYYIRFFSNDTVNNTEVTHSENYIISSGLQANLYYLAYNDSGDTYVNSSNATKNYGTLTTMNTSATVRTENAYVWFNATQLFSSGYKIYATYFNYTLLAGGSSYWDNCTAGFNYTAQNETTLTYSNKATICTTWSSGAYTIPASTGTKTVDISNTINSNSSTWFQILRVAGSPNAFYTKEFAIPSAHPLISGIYAGAGNIFVNSASDSSTGTYMISNVSFTNTTSTISFVNIGTTSYGSGNFSYVSSNQMNGLVTTTVVDRLGLYYPAHFYHYLYNTTAPIELYPTLINKTGTFIGTPTFYVANPAGVPVPNAILNVYNNLNGAWVLSQQGLTDSSGAVTLFLYTNVQYRITATDGTTTSSVYTITPTLPSYSIILGVAGANPTPNIFDTINWLITPLTYQIPYSNSTPVTFKVSDSASSLDSLEMWLFYANNTLITHKKSSVPAGATLTANINTTVPNNTLIKGFFGINRIGFADYNITRNFVIKQYTNYSYSLTNVMNAFKNESSISDGWKQIIVFGMAIGCAIAVFKFAGDMGALLTFAVVITVAVFFGWIGWVVAMIIWLLVVGYALIRGGMF